MASLSATEALKRLDALIDELGNAALLAEADWNAIQETLDLVSIPGMRESILDGLATPVADLSDQPGW